MTHTHSNGLGRAKRNARTLFNNSFATTLSAGKLETITLTMDIANTGNTYDAGTDTFNGYKIYNPFFKKVMFGAAIKQGAKQSFFCFQAVDPGDGRQNFTCDISREELMHR